MSVCVWKPGTGRRGYRINRGVSDRSTNYTVCSESVALVDLRVHRARPARPTRRPGELAKRRGVAGDAPRSGSPGSALSVVSHTGDVLGSQAELHYRIAAGASTVL